MSDVNKELMRRFYDEAVNGQQFDAIDELVSADFVDHEEFPGLPGGREGAKQFFKLCHSAFEGFSMEVEDLIAEGDRVVARCTMSGTQRGEFAGIPSSGKALRVSVIDIVRVADGKVAEHWGAMDSGSMMQQLS